MDGEDGARAGNDLRMLWRWHSKEHHTSQDVKHPWVGQGFLEQGASMVVLPH
jgi:hypothetical protein